MLFDSFRSKLIRENLWPKKIFHEFKKKIHQTTQRCICGIAIGIVGE